MLLQPRVVHPISISVNDGPSAEEVEKYVKTRALSSPIRVWLKNLGAKNASNVNVKIVIAKRDGVVLYDAWSFPKRPRSRLMPAFRIPTAINVDSDVRESASAWTVEVSAKTIQPQDEFWSSDDIYIAAASNQTIDATASIFADDLAKPIEVPLRIHVKVVERQIAPEDFQGEDD
jgi:hypothetical protein